MIPPAEKILDHLGKQVSVELKNRHFITGKLVFYHLTEQTVHLSEWNEYDEKEVLVRQGVFMIVNRTAWFQLYL